jgi:hypothetical protein
MDGEAMPFPTMTRKSCVSIPSRFGGPLLRRFGTPRIDGSARKIIPAFCLLLLGTAGAVLAGPYTREEGFDRPGADFETFAQDHSYPDHDNCRAACESKPDCRSYTYVHPGVAGPHALCRLKSRTPPPVEDACCISGVKGGKPPQRAVPSLELEWLGWAADKVGKDPQPQAPDGAPDHHLQLGLKLASMQEIAAIELAETDGHGRPAEDGLRWSTQDAAAEYLAAETDGRRLNPAAAATLGPHAGNAVFDLYAHDIGQWNVHGSIVAAVLLADGRRLAHAFTLESPPDRLLGLWQMHCNNPAPQAFEPMTISGRLQLILQPDDSITGYFGVLPLKGKLDPSGGVAGSAEASTARVVWQGQLDKAGRGKPPRGSGSFKFERAQDGCLGEGVWSNQ